MSASRTTVTTIRNALSAAGRAPSLHNIQPWRWVLDADELHLYLDRGRVLPSDRGGREAVIGCGAALDHLRVAIAAAGMNAIIERLPNPNNPDHLASIQFTPMSYVTDGHRLRAEAIWARHSDRLPLNPPSNWATFEPVLRSRIKEYEVQLDVLPESARARLAQASQLTESLRLYDSAYHAELHRWAVPFASSEGVPYDALTSAAEAQRVDVGRRFPTPHHAERRAQISEDRSMVAVLSTTTDTRVDALVAGEELSAVLLECTMAGLATCPLTHLTEVQVARDIVETLLGTVTLPQVLVRIGTAPVAEDIAPRTPRRPLDDVLTVLDG